MNFQLQSGTYVVAVSGGVDSMALLDLLAKNSEDSKLIVAHFDHGIRPDSNIDRELVQEAAEKYGLDFVYDEGKLGFGTSEEKARDARYKFLNEVAKKAKAEAIFTAHHQDDLIETAMVNMLRGTNRAGLVSLRSRPGLERPLLKATKKQLINYAKDQGLVWREDATNADQRYLRNYVRHTILPKITSEKRSQLLGHINKAYDLHHQIDMELTNHLHLHPGISELDRHWFIMLPHNVTREVLAKWLRRHHVRDMSSKMLERLIIACKTNAPNTSTDVDKHLVLEVRRRSLALRPRER